MCKVISATVLVIVLAAVAEAQVKNVAYAEVGGNGGALTVNYEHPLKSNLFGRVGLSTVSSSSDSGGGDSLAIIVPVMVGYLSHAASNHHLEAGAGMTVVTGDRMDSWGEGSTESFSNVVGTMTVGYRYQRPQRGFVFRAGFTPIFDQHEFAPWAGMSCGYAW